MTDIFDTKIVCKRCNIEMKPIIIEKSAVQMRAVRCTNCNDTIIHPSDLESFEHYNNLKGRTFTVKLRMVGNSHAISIPKEIVDFMNEMHKHMKREMDDMVRLSFEDMNRLSVMFGDEEEEYEKGDR